MISRQTVCWSLTTVLAATAAAWLTVRLSPPPLPGDSEASFHQWLHHNLEITPEQDALLAPHEHAFESGRREQREAIDAAGAELARAIRSAGDATAPEVEAALRRLIEEQGELQRLTLEHFFAMKAHLTPEQGEKLLRWTHDSIAHGSHR